MSTEHPRSMDASNSGACVLDTLKCATHEAHQRLHQVVDLHHMTGSQADYLDSLRRYLSVVEPLEQGLLAFCHQNLDCSGMLISWSERLRKSQWLREDLDPTARNTGAKAPPPDATTVRPVVTMSAFVGRTYVIEGLTLGAVPILRMIARAPALSDVGRRRFFSGYRGRTAEYWQDYRLWVGQQPLDTQAAVDEALVTFSLFASALRTR